MEGAGKTRKLEKDIEEELGDDYTVDLKKNYDLPEAFKYDKIPEFWNGHNIQDFIDPEILEVGLVKSNKFTANNFTLQQLTFYLCFCTEIGKAGEGGST